LGDKLHKKSYVLFIIKFIFVFKDLMVGFGSSFTIAKLQGKEVTVFRFYFFF